MKGWSWQLRLCFICLFCSTLSTLSCIAVYVPIEYCFLSFGWLITHLLSTNCSSFWSCLAVIYSFFLRGPHQHNTGQQICSYLVLDSFPINLIWFLLVFDILNVFPNTYNECTIQYILWGLIHWDNLCWTVLLFFMART